MKFSKSIFLAIFIALMITSLAPCQTTGTLKIKYTSDWLNGFAISSQVADLDSLFLYTGKPFDFTAMDNQDSIYLAYQTDTISSSGVYVATADTVILNWYTYWDELFKGTLMRSDTLVGGGRKAIYTKTLGPSPFIYFTMRGKVASRFNRIATQWLYTKDIDNTLYWDAIRKRLPTY
jgi:hypothetical protein